jgi:hypothetical protein
MRTLVLIAVAAVTALTLWTAAAFAGEHRVWPLKGSA